MTVEALQIGEPFFGISHITDEASHPIGDKTIVLNLSETPLKIEEQSLGFLQSVVVANTAIQQIEKAVIIERFAAHDDDTELFERVKKVWPLAYDMCQEERLKGVSHYMGPKTHIGNVELHKEHSWCQEPGFKEIHTQLVGYGKMQPCREKDVATLYPEEPMAPGTTHKPMYDEEGNYPWHQFETVTPSIFMAVVVYRQPSPRPHG